MDNVRALPQLFFAQMLEEQQAFEVADRLLELFEAGQLPVGDGARPLFEEWRGVRANQPPGGDGDAKPNRDFGDLWVRFLAGVSSFERQQDTTGIEKRALAAIELLSHPDLRIRALLLRSPGYRRLPPDAQQQIAHDTSRVADHLVQSVDFPGFVAGLIEGTFQAIVDASVQQMEAYAKLVHDVAQSIECP